MEFENDVFFLAAAEKVGHLFRFDVQLDQAAVVFIGRRIAEINRLPVRAPVDDLKVGAAVLVFRKLIDHFLVACFDVDQPVLAGRGGPWQAGLLFFRLRTGACA